MMCECLVMFGLLECVSFYGSVVSENVAKEKKEYQHSGFNFTVDELLSSQFPRKTSNDSDLDPCKAVQHLEDIAFPFTYEKAHLANRGHSIVTRAVSTARAERVWEHGVIPYEIDGNFSGSHKVLFRQAMKHWENYTCIKFVERNPEEHPNYIIFTERPCGCCSFVGKRGNGGQAISIGKNCDKLGIIVHELGHVVGFWHEHTRPDRDKHVNILWNNIMSGQESNFNKLTEDEVTPLGVTYDYESIMHYAKNTFSKGIYLDTIRPVELPGKKIPEIGQRLKLSKGDITQTNVLYKCPKCGRTFQTNSGTFSSPMYKTSPPESVRCQWTISASHGEIIIVNITDLNIEKSPGCKNGYLEIRDGYWRKSPLLGSFCGTGHFINIVSSSNRMLITYFITSPRGHRGFTATYQAICGGDLLLDKVGHLESPNYPEEYQPNKNCTWRISVPQSHQVALHFHSFELEHHDTCLYDYVEIRDGFAEDSPIIGIHCGYKIPSDVMSSSNKMLVRFVSDDWVQKGGFSASIVQEYDECSKIQHGCQQKCLNTLGSFVCACEIGYELHSDGKTCQVACGGILNISNGIITSPFFPDYYPKNKICIWEIVAQPQYKITVNFTHFDLEGNVNNNQIQQQCEYDKVDIYSKLVTDGTVKQHGTFCGPRSPGLVTSEENVLRIEFYSDSTVQKSGFAALFFTDIDECTINHAGCQQECINTPGSYHCTCYDGYTLHENGHDCKEGGDCKYEISTPDGNLSSPNFPDLYPPKKNCSWLLKTTPGHRITVSFVLFELESHQECFYDHLDFYDGATSDAYLLGRFCGSKRPDLVVGSTNRLYMSFTSDASTQRGGFLAKHSTVCGGVLIASFQPQYIYSHANFGTASYENVAECDWTIEASGGYNVRLSFLTFDLEDEAICGFDYVEIFSGADSRGPSYGRYCGMKESFDVISIHGALLLRFKTDDTVVSKGFSVLYEAVEVSFSEEEDI